MSVTDKLTIIAENEQKVYEAGQEYQKKHFFQIFQKNGTRTDYNNAFYGEGWNDETYNPLYPIVSTSQATQTGIFYLSEITDTKVPITVAGKIQTLFGASKIKIIRKLIFDGVTSITNVFNLCADLEELNVEGIIEVDGINLRWSKNLTYDSCHSIFTHLKDFRQNLVDNVTIPSNTIGYAFAEYTLVEEQKYSGHYLNPGYGSAYFNGTAQKMEVPNRGETIALVFEVVDSMGMAHQVYIYNNNGSVRLFDTYDVSFDCSISMSTITEARTITMPKAVRDNGNATPEDIAEAEAKGWEIAWAE